MQPQNLELPPYVRFTRVVVEHVPVWVPGQGDHALIITRRAFDRREEPASPIVSCTACGVSSAGRSLFPFFPFAPDVEACVRSVIEGYGPVCADARLQWLAEQVMRA